MERKVSSVVFNGSFRMRIDDTGGDMAPFVLEAVGVALSRSKDFAGMTVEYAD
jgi:hypothetical protein